MSKKNIRILALGFFLSGLILVLSILIVPTNSEADAQNQEEVKTLKSEVSYLQNQIAEMEVAQADTQEAAAPDEKSEEEPEATNEDAEDENEEESEENPEEDAEQPSDDEEEPVISTTVTIGDGQPSSVATTQLMEQNIIEDRFDFDKFLEDKDYAPLVRPGTYEINSNMNYEEIAQALMGR
ncbi:hypothetical protein [Marinilactibacillus kalidii]|uniref:hypothetical protein n=1 Tax=Marinilactibacillus kalidii TaxID=2820274 RepID=UPI001ABE8756|nr:hypothetical protein [Marinilactibacillus kalidii]